MASSRGEPDVEPAPLPPAHGALVDFTEENDALVGTDRHYTQGARLAYLGGDNQMPDWMLKGSQAIPVLGFEAEAHRLGFEIGQDIYTPADLHATELLVNDRPYAGWLYAGLDLQRRGTTRQGRIPVLENFRLTLGIVGPDALGRDAQDWFHRIISEHAPQGWNNQLPAEPGFALKYQRAWRFAAPPQAGLSADAIPHAGFSLGNVDTSFRVGALGRVGWHLPDDFGVQTIHSLAVPDGGRLRTDPPWRVGFYFFAGAEGSAVLYTTFLDGDAFRASHHVQREPFVGEIQGGAALSVDRVELALTVAYRTREFTGRHGGDGYGSLLMKYGF